MLRRLLGCPKGSDANYLKAPSVESTLAERCMCTRGRILKYTKCRLWTRRIKMTGRRKPKKCPLKVIQITMRTWLWDSESIHVSTYFSFFFLINTLLVSLLSICMGILFLQSQRARALSLTSDLELGLDALITVTQPQPLTRNWSSTWSLCRLSHPRSRSYSICLSLTYFVYITLSNIHVAASGTKSFFFMAE